MLHNILLSFCTEEDDNEKEKYSFGVYRKSIRKFGTLHSFLLDIEIPPIVEEKNDNSGDGGNETEEDDMEQLVDEEDLAVVTTGTFRDLRTICQFLHYDLMKTFINKSSRTWPAILPIMSYRAARENRKDILEYIHELVRSSKMRKTKYLAYYLWDAYDRDLYSFSIRYYMIYDWFFEQPSIWTDIIFVIAYEHGNIELAKWLEESIGFINTNYYDPDPL